MKKLMVTIAAASAVGILFAEGTNAVSAAAASTIPEEQHQEKQAIAEKTVQDMIDEYLSSKGWSGGLNEKAEKKFFVATGTGVIQAPREGANYIGSRMNAFNKAMLEAKKTMVEYMGTEIESETLRSYQEGEFPSHEALKEKEDSNSICGKVKALLRAKLDTALRKEGVDPYAEDKAKAAEAAKKLLATEQYSKFIKTAANAYVLGLQAVCTFEGVPANDKGEIGVVAIWSPKLQEMATSIMTGVPIAKVAAKKPISEQIAKDPGALLSTFGVQQKIDEHGDLILVSFGQAGGVSESKMAAKGAQGKAKAQALALIREFAGEQVSVAADALNAESTEEFEKAAEEYRDTSAYAEKIKAVAAKIDMAGVSVVRNWSAKHPLNGRMVYGCVCAWAPKQASLAKELRATMSATPRKPVAGGASAPVTTQVKNVPTAVLQSQAAKPAPKASAKSLDSAGQSGDDDAF